MWGRSTPSSCAGVGGRVVPSWDVLGLGVPPNVLSSGAEVLPGNVLRSGEDVGSRDLKGPTHITVAPHIDPAALGHAPTPATPLPPLGHSPWGELRRAVRQWGALQALALGFQLVSLGWQRWQWGSRPAVSRGLLPKRWWRGIL